MAEYSGTDKMLHRIYLGNYSISKASYEMERLMYGKKADNWRVDQLVFVTGLARSGTTALMRTIFETGEYASLQYSNMPFLLCPNLWNRNSNISEHERAHQDGIMVDGNSPEEFDEYFWKAFLNDGYIEEDSMLTHDLSAETLDKYREFINHICLSKNKHRYISKNNNNILRLPELGKLQDSRILILFREPLSHASSLLKLHNSFCRSQQEDPFELDYFNFLGHHEFGINHKPFHLNTKILETSEEYDRSSLDYWLCIWINYYKYVTEQLSEKYQLVCFEDLIDQPEKTYSSIFQYLALDSRIKQQEKHRPKKYNYAACSERLKNESAAIYSRLLERNASQKENLLQ